MIVEKPISVTSLRNASMRRAHPKLLWSSSLLMTATFLGYTSFASAVGPCVRYIYAYTWEYWFHRVSCLLACLRSSWLGYRILTHIHVHRHAAAHKLLTRISPFRAPGAFHRICRRDGHRRYPERNYNLSTRNRDLSLSNSVNFSVIEKNYKITGEQFFITF